MAAGRFYGSVQSSSERIVGWPDVRWLLVAGFTGCGSKAGGDKILIGHYASMTGSEATFGRSTDNGIRLALEEENAAGGIDGKQIEVITYDDKGDAREAGSAVTRLISRDGVVAVLGEVASGLSLVRRADLSGKRRRDGLAVIDQSQGHRNGRQDFPRLLHRSVPGLGRSQVCPRE